jgi:hypothetical protein
VREAEATTDYKLTVTVWVEADDELGAEAVFYAIMNQYAPELNAEVDAVEEWSRES